MCVGLDGVLGRGELGGLGCLDIEPGYVLRELCFFMR